MARVGGIDHLVLRVKDIERWRRFYDLVLGFLGCKDEYNYRVGNIGFHHSAFELRKGR
jgi:catechol 2,3-dioxygenase-like lactoylglutathione lyase family enzyme